MPTPFRSRAFCLVVGIGVLVVSLGGCGLFRSKPKQPEPPAQDAPAQAPQAAPVERPAPPAPPVPPPRPAPPTPPVAPSPAPPASPPAISPAPPPPPTAPHKPAAGRIADEEMLRGLVQGKTTRGEVRELFGVPQEVIMGPGTEMFVYYRDRTSGFFSRSTERIETLTIRFDPKGILKDFEYRYTGK